MSYTADMYMVNPVSHFVTYIWCLAILKKLGFFITLISPVIIDLLILSSCCTLQLKMLYLIELISS